MLPRSSQAQVMEFAMGPTPLVEGLPKPLAPATYIECSRTGDAAWWMEIAGQMIMIGRTRYSEHIDGRAKYNELHRRVKSLFGTLITKDLAARIELRESEELE